MWAVVYLLIFFVIPAIIRAVLKHISAYDKSDYVKSSFFRTLFTVAGHLTKIDGRVNEHEIQQLIQFMNAMNLSPDQRQQAIGHFNRGKAGYINIKDLLNQLKIKITSKDTHKFIACLLQIAYADGQINSSEQTFLEEVCWILNVNPSTLELLKDHHRTQQFFNQQNQYTNGSSYSQQYNNRHQQNNTLQKAYQVLGIQETTSYDDAKRIYRKLMSQNHPDKFVRHEEKQLHAKQKTQAIQTAWNQIQQHLKPKT